MHIRAAHRFLTDSEVAPNIRAFLTQPAHLGPFLFGNVAPDARVSGGVARGETHFFEYQLPITPPQETLFAEHPSLRHAAGAQRAFVAGYIAHLAMDAVWAEDMLFAHFYHQDWESREHGYIMLHVLLCALDAEAEGQWPPQYGVALAEAEPADWLPFMSDEALAAWREVIGRQVRPGGHSETIEVLGQRVPIGPAGVRDILNDAERMQHEIWRRVPPSLIADIREKMYAAMREVVSDYLTAEGAA